MSTRTEPIVEEPALSPSSIRQILLTAMHPVTSDRRIIFTFLIDLELQIRDKIEEQGWSFFFSLNVLTYANLVRSFYENLILGEEHIESKVKGKRIIISEEKLGNLLQMLTEDKKYLELNCRSSALRAILERNDIDEIGIVTASSLSLEIRRLHSFISRIFIPKTGKFDWVSERDLAFMECIIKGEAINLPFIMMGQNKETIRRAKICLPYGMVFTLLFQTTHIDLSGKDEKKLHHSDTYSAKSLMRMGYHLSDGHWKRKVLGEKVKSSSESSSEDEETEEQQPNVEFVTTAEASVQEAEVQEENERQT